MDLRAISDELAGRLTHGFAKVAAEDLKARPSPVNEAVAEFFASLELQESNRAIPILAFSYLEEHLQLALIRNMPGLTPDLEKDLFSYMGPLGTASSQIAVAHSMRWLSAETATELHRIRKIRNHFSHSSDATFDDDIVTGHLHEHSQASIIEAMMGDVDPDEIYMDRVGRHILESPAFDQRLRFVIAAFVTARRSLMELALFPILNRWGVALESLEESATHSDPSELSRWTDGIPAGIETIMDASAKRLTLVDGGPAIDESVGQLRPGSTD